MKDKTWAIIDGKKVFGVWRTVGGQHIFIRDGQSLASAMKDSGKFNNKKEKANKEPKKEEQKTIKDKDVDKYEPKHLYDVGYVPEREALEYANKHDKYNINKTMPDGNEIGDNDKEGLKDIGGPTVSYTMSNGRYYNLSKDERTAINKILSNNKEAEKLEIENTEIINTKSSRKDWHKHLGEAGKHTHEEKNGKGYYDELDAKDKIKIINNDKKIEELKQDSINQAKILDNGPTHGKYPLGTDTGEMPSKGLPKSNYANDKSSKKEKSSGVIVFDNDKVLLVEHSDGRFGFPKGHAEKGEHEEKAAQREVLEETNYNVKIDKGFRQPTQYTAKNGETKTEVYFVGSPTGKNKVTSNTGELKGAKFYSYEEAREKLKNYGNLVSILDKAKEQAGKYTKTKNNKTSYLSSYKEYMKEHPNSKMTFSKFKKMVID